ncbi:LOW QUALITY PROTEIN: uncharacterized protein V1477_011781 [Vespula maculifrons]|uniref:Uncharacterized protein n=1 Tax=Vespula maculifrons TaxID=7453 RepID=A0ABD2C055_VESMC
MKRGGGDTVPLGGNIRRAPLAAGPVMSRISTIQISISTKILQCCITHIFVFLYCFFCFGLPLSTFGGP